jgi:hypothetical protein
MSGSPMRSKSRSAGGKKLGVRPAVSPAARISAGTTRLGGISLSGSLVTPKLFKLCGV